MTGHCNVVRNTIPGWKPVFDQTRFFHKKSSKNCPPGGVGDILPGWKTVFDQTFGKSLVNSLRVGNTIPGVADVVRFRRWEWGVE